MSEWRAAYTNDYGEYEITFESKDRAKTKAVEKVCCAIMDGLVKSPDDVVIGARPKGKWILHDDGSGTCDQCRRRHAAVWGDDNWDHYCPSCGANMEGVVCQDG